MQEEFSKYHIGQRVYYTGETTYDRKVSNEPATIDVIGKCICLRLDDSKRICRDNQHVDVFPQPQRASVGLGDLKSGKKEIRIM